MNEYLNANQRHWDAVTPFHERSALYDVAGFKAGRSSLDAIELEAIGDVAGKSLLHLQCHLGMDTLSWARLGARVTGVDFSHEAISLARSLSAETAIPADVVESNLYDLPNNLDGQLDIVFTSYGCMCWLPDLRGWAETAAHFLAPVGTFYLVEDHPPAEAFDHSPQALEPRVAQQYFHTEQPVQNESQGSYADRNADITDITHQWAHPMGEIVTAIADTETRIEFVHEFPVCCWQRFPFI